MTKKLNKCQIESLESLNKQIIEQNIPNAKPFNLDNEINTNESDLVTIEKIQEIVISSAEKIDLLDYIEKSGDNRDKYINNGKTNIPRSIMAVITCEYAIELINSSGYAIGSLYSNDTNSKTGYLFNGKYWLPISNDFIKNFLREILKKIGYGVLKSKTPDMCDLLLRTFWENVRKTPVKNNENIFINLANCTIEIMQTGEIKQLKFNKDRFLLYSLPYAYDDTKNCPLFFEYLDRVLPDKDSQSVLQELLGSIFIKNINLEKIGILYGSGSNGKSVLLKIITAVLGINNISQVDLKSLTTDKNADNNRAQLMGKLLNFAPEINAKGEQEHDLIKRMASGEAIQVKMLYKDTITITDYAKLIFNANVLPSDVEHSYGFFRRLLIIGFDQVISDEEKDPELANKIINLELPGILNWIIGGAKRLQLNKKFSYCKKSEEILDQYKTESDIVAIWVRENDYIPHKTSTILLQKIMEKLKSFTSENGYKFPSSKTVVKRLRDLGFKAEKPKGYSTKVYIAKGY